MKRRRASRFSTSCSASTSASTAAMRAASACWAAAGLPGSAPPGALWIRTIGVDEVGTSSCGGGSWGPVPPHRRPTGTSCGRCGQPRGVPRSASKLNRSNRLMRLNSAGGHPWGADSGQRWRKAPDRSAVSNAGSTGAWVAQRRAGSKTAERADTTATTAITRTPPASATPTTWTASTPEAIRTDCDARQRGNEAR